MRPADNPFRVERLHALAFRWPQDRPFDLPNQVASLGGRAAILGPQGSGKTTLLLELQQQLSTTRPVRLLVAPGDRPVDGVAWRRFIAPPLAATWLLVDGYDALSWYRRCRLSWAGRRAAGLVVTSHGACRLPVVLRTEPTVELLDQLVCDLATVATDERERINRQLFLRHHGNLRNCLLSWYDLQAGRKQAASR